VLYQPNLYVPTALGCATRGLNSCRSNSSLTHELEHADLDSAGSYRLYSQRSYTVSKEKKQFYTSSPQNIVSVLLASCIVCVRLDTYCSRNTPYQLMQPLIWYLDDMKVKPKTLRFNRRPPLHLLKSSPQMKPPFSLCSSPGWLTGVLTKKCSSNPDLKAQLLVLQDVQEIFRFAARRTRALSSLLSSDPSIMNLTEYRYRIELSTHPCFPKSFASWGLSTRPNLSDDPQKS